MTAVPAPLDFRPGWGRALWAVVWGGLLGAFVVAVPLLALALVGVPALPVDDETTGWGMPWRVDGFWSFAANLGPVVLFGVAFAYGVEGALSSRGRLRWLSRRSPIVLLGVLLALAKSGSGGAPALVAVAVAGAVLVIARGSATPARAPRRWTRSSVGAAVVAGLVLSAVTVSYAVVHPLSPSHADLREAQGGDRSVGLALRNEGRAEATLLAASVPVPGARVEGLDATGERRVALAGARVARGAPQTLVVSMPAGCSASWRVERLDVRLRVLGREVDQVVRLREPVDVPCG